MRSIRRIVLLTMVSIILPTVGCKHTTHPPTIDPSLLVSTTQKKVVASFTRLRVSGNISVSLHTGGSQSYLILKGSRYDINALDICEKQGLLRLNMGLGYPHNGLIHVDVYTPKLTTFIYRGSGTITATNLRSPALDLDIKNNQNTSLEGPFNVHNMILSGSGSVTISRPQYPKTITHQPKVSIILKDRVHLRMTGFLRLFSVKAYADSMMSAYWVDSDDLQICAKDHAYIQLGGSVDRLDVNLTGQARFNGRYLRSKRVFAKTFGQSTAQINAVRQQHTLASDDSNIYYYHIPTNRTDFMAYQGSVLDRREWSLFMQEYDKYNK